MSLPAEYVSVPVERRSGVQRRRPEPAELANVYRSDDRRLGLGRRWEDWCRPATDGRIDDGDVFVTG